jgi:putative protease
MTDDGADWSAPPNAADAGAAPPTGGLELLAPAGDAESLRAALEAGADAVYFGLTVLNARRRARNFAEDELLQAVQDIHAYNARAYLTLNIDLTERELEVAARVLELARRAGVDAVLVRDPALLIFLPEYPELEFHFSTQTCMTNSADVSAATALGASRVVLAREMTLAEIQAASSVPGIQTEVFAQGALCFCISGRCFMSSWVGGRSGNRGACTSPCRVPWLVDGERAGTPLSMHDLATLDRTRDLLQAGVTALKIEGRMKKAAWVREAVGLYRRTLAGEDAAGLRERVRQLGDYTGRQMTCGFLDGQRNDLTGETAGRPASLEASADDSVARESRSDRSSYDFDMSVQPQGIRCRCECAGIVDEWTIPKTVVRRRHKAVSVETLLSRLLEQPIEGCQLQDATTNDPGFLLVPRAVNGLVTRVTKTIRRSQKKRGQMSKVDLPEAVLAILENRSRCPSNRMRLGDPPDRVRLERAAVELFLGSARPDGGVIVEGLTADSVKQVRSLCGRIPLIAALPPVFFEDDIPDLTELVRRCARSDVTVEVNSWGGWHLARRARARMESGPGLPVLNSLAARTLARSRITAVTLSPEADRRQLERVAANCPVPCSLVVFGRPPLMTTRVDLPEDYMHKTLADRRDTRVTARREGGLWVLRPVDPFDLRDVRNERLVVKHLVVDLVGSEDPVRDWHQPPSRRKRLFRFNYERSLY